MKRLLYVVNDGRHFLTHRKSLAVRAKLEGYEIHIAAPESEACSEIRDLGFTFHPWSMTRSGLGLFREAWSALTLWRLYREIRPDLVHHLTIKPVIYGSLAARVARVPASINAITGLGYVFSNRSFKARLVRGLVLVAYRFALRLPNHRIIFQNPDDLDFFVHRGLAKKEWTILIRGSGVDIETYRPTPEPGPPPLVILPSRMLWDKGVGEFVEAASRLRKAGIRARFALVGAPDDGNPASIPRTQLESWVQQGFIEWWGFRRDMPDVLTECSIVCLPSYREGVPRSLIEAAACGRPVVTTDAPGCREIVKHGETGLLVPPRDAVALSAALKTLLEDTPLRRRMGEAGRRLIEEAFSEEIVIEKTLAIYEELIVGTEGEVATEP